MGLNMSIIKGQMFCFQCQEAARGTGCEIIGVCGKSPEVAKLQDLLIYTLKGISHMVYQKKLNIEDLQVIHHEMMNSLFMTITNANFDDEAIVKQIQKMLNYRDTLSEMVEGDSLKDAAKFKVTDKESMLKKASQVGVLAEKNEDIRSLRELIIYGLKGFNIN